MSKRHGHAKRKSYAAIRRGCSDKVRFATGGEAQRAAARHGLEYYPCLTCGGWHLTSRKPNP